MKKCLPLAFFFVGAVVFAASDAQLFSEAEGYYRAGNYALALRFSDGHETGIFPFRFLRENDPAL